MIALNIVIVAVVSYLIGNINFAILISKLLKNDIRKVGSGNPGTMNMIRAFGKAVGALCLALDVLKGVLPAFFGWWVIAGTPCDSTNMLGIYVAGLGVAVGHIFPVFYKFHGGKAIASIIGISLVSNPIVTCISFVVGVLFIAIFKIGAVGSFIIIFTPNIALAMTVCQNDIAVCALIFALVALSLFAHRSNIIRMFGGRENQTILFKKKRKTQK